MVVKKSNIGHLIKIFGYKTLKILRSYSASNVQDRTFGSHGDIFTFEIKQGDLML